MDLAHIIHELEENSDDEHVWDTGLQNITQIIRQRPLSARQLCIKLSTTCVKALGFTVPSVRKRGLIVLCDLAYDDKICMLWDLNSREVESMVICLENGPAIMRTLAKEALARWVTPYPDRTIPLVQQLIDRMKQGPFPGEEAMSALVHLGTELMENVQLFVEEVYKSAEEELYLEQLRRMVMMVHIAEKEISAWRGRWMQLVQAFMECRDALSNTEDHQAAIQRIFLDEIMHFFAYDVFLQLRTAQAVGMDPMKRLSLVIECLSAHLEDFNVRLKSRDFVFNEESEQLERMSSLNRMKLYNRVTLLMTEPLMVALSWAAGHVNEDQVEEERLKCGQLLEDKTRITAETHDREMLMYQLLLDAVALVETEETDWLHHELARALIADASQYLPSVEIKVLTERLRKVRIKTQQQKVRFTTTHSMPNRYLWSRANSMGATRPVREEINPRLSSSTRFTSSEPLRRLSTRSSHLLIFPSDVAPSTLLS